MTEQYQHRRFSFSLVMLLAWRNLWRYRRRTLITAVSIAVSFAFALNVQALNDGAHASMIANAIKLGNGHIAIQPRGYEENPANYKLINHSDRLLQTPLLRNLAGTVDPRITLNVLASTAHNSTAASIQSGVASSDQKLRLFKEFLVEGHWLDDEAPLNVVMGTDMARQLNVGLGNKVVFMSANEQGDSVAFMAKVGGIFRSNITEVDKFVVLTTLTFGQKFLAEEIGNISNPVTRISISLNELDQAASQTTVLSLGLSSELSAGQLEILSWQQMMPDLLQFIQVDDVAGFIMLGLILIMVIFGVANTLFMSVLERTREFALLHVIGLSKLNLVVTTVLETLFLSVLSLMIGWVLGLSVYHYLSISGIDVSSAAENSLQIANTVMDPVIYSKLTAWRLMQFTLAAFLSTMIVGIYPAIRAGRVAPVRALQS